MKIKLIDINFSLPNCWKQCGVDKSEWDKLNKLELSERVIAIMSCIRASIRETVRRI